MLTPSRFLSRAIGLGGLLAGLASLAPAVRGAAPGAPNVVILFADDLGWSEVGYQGTRFATPHLDALARRGMVFSRAYAASPTCSPSRSGLLTGRHPAELGVVRHLPAKVARGQEFHDWPQDPAGMPSRNGLPAGALTYGHALQRLGYHTAFHGKWHLGGGERFPVHFGFHEQVGTTDRGQPASYLAPFWPDPVYQDAPPGTYLTDRQTDDAVAFIAANRGRRFLLSLFYYAVHTPKIGRPDHVAAAKARGLTGLAAEYDAMLRSLDDSVGRIVAAVETAGLRENTVVVFASDQGSWFERPPLRGSKEAGTALFEGGARVPLLVSWPARVRAGSRCESPVSLTDVFPTLVEIAGGRVADYRGLDGRSLLPVLLERGPVARERIVLYRSYDNQYAAVVEGPWKLIAHRDGHHELYQVLEDIGEADNRAGREIGIAQRLATHLADWEASLGLRLAPGARFPAGWVPASGGPAR
ncbi:MAG: sulfatase-like hydrolase/transferase [Verrucomicrobia bacterium]|nr:sulfatase-like hydrolase/transferase [Verrucomicrobiota bacterium]